MATSFVKDDAPRSRQTGLGRAGRSEQAARDHRREVLRSVGFNLFAIPSSLVAIDLLTDSGTGVMSSAQWEAMKRADESYAGSASYHRLVGACEEILGIANVIPTCQGRAAERLLVELMIGSTPAGRGQIVPNNAHFDTTSHMIQASGAEALDLPADAPPGIAFRGDMDVPALERLLSDGAARVPFVMLTLTCNSNGGQPVSLRNIRAVRDTCDRFGKPLFFDACRFAENAWFIQQNEPDMRGRSIAAVTRSMFDLCDGAAMSARKDGLCNTGGMLLLRGQRQFSTACGLTVLTQGFGMGYGGLAGRDMEAMAVGLREATAQAYLDERIGQVQRLGRKLLETGVPIVHHCAMMGGHAIFIDAETFCPHLSRADRPAHALACALFEHSGIRGCAIGTVLRNSRGEPMEIVRLAIPRRRYSQSQMDSVAGAVSLLHVHQETVAPVTCGVAAHPANLSFEAA